MVGRCTHCCNLMNNRIDVSDLDVGTRIRVGENDLATIKYIGEVRLTVTIYPSIYPTFCCISPKSDSFPIKSRITHVWPVPVLFVFFSTHFSFVR